MNRASKYIASFRAKRDAHAGVKLDKERVIARRGRRPQADPTGNFADGETSEGLQKIRHNQELQEDLENNQRATSRFGSRLLNFLGLISMTLFEFSGAVPFMAEFGCKNPERTLFAIFLTAFLFAISDRVFGTTAVNPKLPLSAKLKHWVGWGVCVGVFSGLAISIAYIRATATGGSLPQMVVMSALTVGPAWGASIFLNNLKRGKASRLDGKIIRTRIRRNDGVIVPAQRRYRDIAAQQELWDKDSEEYTATYNAAYQLAEQKRK